MSKAGINFSILVNVRCNHPRARLVVDVEDTTLAYVNEETNVLLATKR
jgi:hypothetical protein